MNRWQKMAWFTLIVTGIGLLISIPTVVVLALRSGFPKALAGFGFMGIVGLTGLTPVIFRKEPGHIDSDERDSMIHRRASWAGFGASYAFFGVVCITIWAIIGIDGSISVNVLPQIFIGAMVAMLIAQSVAILVGYGRRSKNGE